MQACSAFAELRNCHRPMTFLSSHDPFLHSERTKGHERRTKACRGKLLKRPVFSSRDDTLTTLGLQHASSGSNCCVLCKTMRPRALLAVWCFTLPSFQRQIGELSCNTESSFPSSTKAVTSLRRRFPATSSVSCDIKRINMTRYRLYVVAV
jgi:hypothetical protein